MISPKDSKQDVSCVAPQTSDLNSRGHLRKASCTRYMASEKLTTHDDSVAEHLLKGAIDSVSATQRWGKESVDGEKERNYVQHALNLGEGTPLLANNRYYSKYVIFIQATVVPPLASEGIP